MYCTHCGAAQSDTARFCGRCGSQMDEANRDPQAPPEQAPPAAAARQPPAPASESAPPARTSYWASRAVPPVEYPPPATPSYPPPQPAAPAYTPPQPVPAYTPPQPAVPAYTPPQPVPAYTPPQPAAPAAPAAPDGGSPLLRHHRAIAAAAVIVLGGLAVVGWRVHWPPALFGSAAPPALTWTPAQAALPADATRTASQDASLNDVACPGAGSCVAVGFYDSGSSANVGRGLIETLSGGVWTPSAVPATVPGATQVTFVDLDGVACPSMGTCVAVGSYYDRQNIERPLTETRSGSTWIPARLGLPGDADQNKAAFLSEVACPAPGSCVAIGWYIDSNNDVEGLIETLSGGTWTAFRAPVPDDASVHPFPANGGLPPTALIVVRCATVGDCVATGDYTDLSGGMQPLIDTLSDGTWTADRGPVPGNAAAPNPYAFLWAVACQAPGSCVAGGHYNTRGGQSRDLVATQSGGTWIPAATPLPPDAAATQQWSSSEITGLTAMTCQAVGTCLAGGSYIVRNGTLEGVLDAQSGGTWTAVRAPLPAGAAVAKQFVFFDSAACPTSGSCFFVGGYKAADGSTQTLIETGAPKSG